MKILFQLCAWLLFYSAVAYGQDSVRTRDTAAWWRGDRSERRWRDSSFRRDSIAGRPDSVRQRGRGFSSLFADSTKLDTADYQAA
ncbi:MAG TPA: hypothetical protein PLQ65_09620, partial [Flavihumibacter sp.]|nr:hypothetical protein [Flavihumibacter sp.]